MLDTEIPDTEMPDAQTFDAVVIGGGPAGLQAALTLGRMHREVLLLDSGEYRNDPVEHAHNFITLDGVAPGEIRARALRDVAAYGTVQRRAQRADAVDRDGTGFVVTSCGATIRTRAVVLATGVRDILPDVPGLAELWGVEAATCPFCHGHELAGKRVALLGAGDHAAVLCAMLDPVAAETVQLEVDEVERVERFDGGVRLVRHEGEPVETAGIFVRTDIEQSAPFAEQLGLDLLPTGCIAVDQLGRTSVPGVYAAGDLASRAEFPMPMASILVAASAGLVAAATCVRELAVSTL
jgi:thioredoxin reductase